MTGASEQSIFYSDEKFTELRARNCYAYELIFEIEVTMRELIQFLLQKAYGKRWVKEGLPSDVRDKIKAGAEYERRTPWNRLICHRPLYYVDFPDLKKIIINGKNWRAAFEEEFVAKTLADSSLTEIEAIRNAVAHNRIVSNEDITVLEGSHAKLLSVRSKKI